MGIKLLTDVTLAFRPSYPGKKPYHPTNISPLLSSGLSFTSSQERGVTPVYLRCREGAVTWMYPRGALRLLFRPPLPGDERDFSVCVRVIRRDDPPDLFREVEIGAEDIEGMWMM